MKKPCREPKKIEPSKREAIDFEKSEIGKDKIVKIRNYITHKNNVQGKVIITFVMSKTGEATNVRIFRGIDPALDYRSPQSGKQPATLEIWKAKRKTGKWKLYYPYKPYSTVSLKQYF